MLMEDRYDEGHWLREEEDEGLSCWLRQEVSAADTCRDRWAEEE